MMLVRQPRPALRPFVETLWLIDGAGEPPPAPGRREHVLPTGLMHLVFRLSNAPLRIFRGPDDAAGEVVGDAVVGGPRATFYIRDVSTPVSSVGAQLRPGAARALFGVPAGELSGRHTRVDDLWGRHVASVRDRLAGSGPLERLDRFEAILAERLPAVRGLHPAVARALRRFAETSTVHEVVEDSGYSHRAFLALFRQAVGLTPKQYSRVQRLRRALRHAFAGDAAWADLAAAAGYCDQAHLNREFRELTGLTPGEYRRAAPRAVHHVPVGP